MVLITVLTKKGTHPCINQSIPLHGAKMARRKKTKGGATAAKYDDFIDDPAPAAAASGGGDEDGGGGEEKGRTRAMTEEEMKEANEAFEKFKKKIPSKQ